MRATTGVTAHTEPKRHLSIAIIGAGISGIQCARTLLSSNTEDINHGDNYYNGGKSTLVEYHVQIFEKARSVSGRMATRRALNNTVHFNHGAQYFTARSNIFLNQVVIPLQQRGVIKELDSSRIRVIARRSQREDDQHYELQEPSSESSKTARYVALPGNSAVVKFMASQQDLIDPSTIHLQKRVQSLRRDETQNKWVLEIENDKDSDPFDMVVITAPLDQTIQLLEDTQQRNASVDLSGMIKECSSGKMNPCWAFMLAFECDLSQVDQVPFDSCFVNDHGSISWMMKTQQSNANDTSSSRVVQSWVVHASTDWSSRNLELDARVAQERLKRDFIELMTSIGSSEYVKYANEPLYMSAHRWRYSIPSPAVKGSNGKPYLYDTDSQIACCGDWLNGGRVEGAFMSGHELAKEICSKNLCTEQ